MRCAFFIALLFGPGIACLHAAAIESHTDYLTARQALADGLPEVAAVKAEKLLAAEKLPLEDRRFLSAFAAESWVRAGKGARALLLISGQDFEGSSFWKAQALMMMGRLQEAREELASHETELDVRSRLLLGRILLALGETDAARSEASFVMEAKMEADLRRQAILLQIEADMQQGRYEEALQRITQNGTAEVDVELELLRARAELELDRFVEARETLKQAQGTPRGGQRARDAASTLLAGVMLREGQSVQATTHMIQALDASVESSLWPEMFDMLDRAWLAQPKPRTIPSLVLQWAYQGSQAQQSADPPPALALAIEVFRGHAWFLTASWLRAEGRRDEAVSMAEALLYTQSEHPRASAAMRLAMDLHAAAGVDVRVLELAEMWRARFSGAEGSSNVDFLAGSILHRLGEHQAAEESFQAAANVAANLPERRRALFNAAVSASKAADVVLFLGLMAQLEATGGSQDLAGDSAADLQLEKALEAAAKRQDGAEDDLRAFINTRSSHPRLAEARLALAEWLLITPPARTDEARSILDAIVLPADEKQTTQALRQRIDHTRLWMLEVAGDTRSLITAATDFLAKWPASPLSAEVLMKRAAAYYQMDDYANARAGFEQVAKDYPKSAQYDTALYFAALSAMSVMSEEGRSRAMEIWDTLASQKSALALPSRRQQALALRRLGDLPSALAALDLVLAIQPLDDDTRRVTLCEKAEVLLLMGKTEPVRLEEAVGLLENFLAKETEAGFLWKSRAGHTLAVTLHAAGRDTLALEACYDVLRAADTSPPANSTEYAWYSKTGFFGIELLQAAHQWEAAARLAEQMSQLPGDRAEDARQLATKIRLEHFLWDGPKPVPPRIPESAPPSAPPQPAPASSEKDQSPTKR